MSQKHSTVLPAAIPLPLTNEVLKELVPKAIDWALMHGVGMRHKKNFYADGLSFAPFVLTPSTFPQTEFQRAVQLQPILNTLLHSVAHNREFLVNSLKETIKVDKFTKQLFDIYDKVYEEGVTQQASIGVLRSDYMIHSLLGGHIKQVEINTIASSFGGITTRIHRLNRFVLEELGYVDKTVNLPENHALQGICTGMLEAHKLYNVPPAIILFVVEDVTYNICDQRFHEFEIRRLNPNVRVKRRSLTEIANAGRLGDKKQLLIDDFEVAVVYFRAGYEPNHYHSVKEWEARLMIERSLAIKCPSIHYHLAGTKKVQQELARPGVLEMFLLDAKDIESVRAIFTGLYSLDFDEDGDRSVRMALAHPERFVLKPQREGGGNNVYDLDIRDAINKMKDSPERTAWILMDRIQPPISRSYMIRPGQSELPEIVDMVSELGIFGFILGNEHEIIANRQIGHMLRTKLITSNEGGVAAGSGALDSPYLID